MHDKNLVSRGVSLALLLAAGSALAQQPAATDQLEEITVTAQFRSENLQETPLAITAVTGDMLEARSQTSIYEVAQQAPNVFLAPQAQANGSGLIAYIRGVEDSMNGVRFCITAGASSAQQVAFIVKYVKAHPEEWHNGATTLIVQALQPAYPCATAQ